MYMYMGVRRNFVRGGKLDILLIIFRLLTISGAADGGANRPLISFRTVARMSSIGGLYVCVGGFTFVQGGLDIQF